MLVRVREPLILFDGVCNLRNAWARFVIRRDPRSKEYFSFRRAVVAYRSGDNRRSPDRRKPFVQRYSDRGQSDLHAI
jgi:predicted DCC family thiol-disulfide oxidoreductase YuxK